MCVRICLGHSAVRKYLIQDQIRSSTRTKNELQNWMGNQELWRAGSDHSQIEFMEDPQRQIAERQLSSPLIAEEMSAGEAESRATAAFVFPSRAKGCSCASAR